MIGKGKAYGDLYFLEIDKKACNVVVQNVLAIVDNSYNSNNFASDVKVWHIRLGHPLTEVLTHISPYLRNKANDYMFCEVCIRAKMHRLPFTSSIITITKPFELLHLDVWGPYHENLYQEHDIC